MKNAHEQKLKHIISRMQTDRSIDAPADALKYVRNLFRTRGAEPSLLQRIVAVLKVDLAPNRAACGERSATGGAARQMLFESGDNAIDLRIEKSGNRFTVKGQILGEGFAASEIQIANTENCYASKSNELSEFTVKNITKGRYILSLIGNQKELLIENLEII